MSTTVKWKVFARLGRDVQRAGDVKTVAFNAAPSPGIYAQFSLPLSRGYIPLVLTPTATFFQAIKTRLVGSASSLESAKLPYLIEVEGAGRCTVALQIRLYPPDLLAMTVRLSAPTDISLKNSFDKLLSWRNPCVPVVRELIKCTAGIINSGDHKQPTSDVKLQVFAGFHLAPVASGDEMPGYVTAEGPRLVALLLGVARWHSMEEALVSKTYERNKELNAKSREECFLLNKQGLVLLTPSSPKPGTEIGRFSRTLDLVEIARVFQMFLDAFPHNRAGHEDFADFIYSQIRAWLKEPAAVLAASYTNRLAWDLLVEAFGLMSKLSLTERMNRELVKSIESKERYFAQISDRWWETPDFAAGFDIASLAKSRVLGRLTDAALRKSILEDLREAETSLSGKNFKAAVVMSGAAVEAMLLALLEQETNVPADKLRSKALHEYLDLVRAHGLIPDTAMLNLLDNSLREWRNYVHPGKALRMGMSLSGDHAKIVVAAASALANSLTMSS